MEVKPNLKKFKIVAFRGYDISEVDEFIDNKLAEYEDIVRDQKSRIAELLEDNRKIKIENERVGKIEKNMSLALLHANEKSDQIIAQAKALADAEIKRVRIFRAKWEYFAKEMLGTLSPKQQLYFDRMSSRIEQTLSQFSDNTEHMKRVAFTSAENVHNKKITTVNQFKDNASIRKQEDKPAIELSEIYEGEESLSDLMQNLSD